MSTVQTFKLVTELIPLTRRDFEVNSVNYVDPEHADVILMGEFVELNDSYKIIRGTGADVPHFAVFVEKGRSDIQAIRMMTCLFLGGYEADTLIFDSLAPPALGAKLEVDPAVTYNGKTVSGLKTWGAGAHIGYVTRRAVNNNDYLRFLQTMV
jgi:hypothetical protein